MKIWSLQILRFFAALAVVVYHASNAAFQTGRPFGLLGLDGAMFGRAGVDLFFVLSGVIITLTARGLTAGEFLAKRARRILPLYGGFTALYLLVASIGPGVEWRVAITSLTLWPALDQLTPPIVTVAWTLCFEALFYVAAAVVLWRPKLLYALLVLYAAALMSRSNPVLCFVGNPLIVEFLLGAGIAFLPRWRPAMLLIPPALAVAWLAPIAYPTTLDVPDFLVGEMAWQRVLHMGLPAAAIVWGTLQFAAREGILTRLGDASYALYLSHLPLVLGLVFFFCRHTALPADAIVLIATVSSVLLGWRVHEIVEKPMLGWFRAPRVRSAVA